MAARCTLVLTLALVLAGCARAPSTAILAMPADALEPEMNLRSGIAMPAHSTRATMSIAQEAAAVWLPPQCVDELERPRRCGS